MLTIEKADAELADLREEAKDASLPIKAYCKLRKRAEHLESIRGFLESKPNREYMERECKRLRSIISNIHEGFEQWCKNQVWYNEKMEAIPKERKSEYDRMMEIAKHRRHLKNTLFILNG
jgi:hypothetical protein